MMGPLAKTYGAKEAGYDPAKVYTVSIMGGLWPFCRGAFRLPRGERALFLPQRPYLPIAKLADAVTYPDPAAQYEKEAIREALAACGLTRLLDRLDEERHWSQELSPGEQQRLAFARVLLLKPRWLFCDEASSALDEPTEQALHTLLLERLPDIGLVSIAHRPSLAAFHQQVIRFAPTGQETGPRYRLEPARATVAADLSA